MCSKENDLRTQDEGPQRHCGQRERQTERTHSVGLYAGERVGSGSLGDEGVQGWAVDHWVMRAAEEAASLS